MFFLWLGDKLNWYCAVFGREVSSTPIVASGSSEEVPQLPG